MKRVFAAGFALFSMFFGAGDLIWPLILGGSAGDKNIYALIGFLLTGIVLPLLGLMAMMLFKGDHKAFFSRLGVIGAILFFIIQALLGPIATIPRLITLSFANLKPYLPLSLEGFILLSCIGLLFISYKKHRIIDILGFILTPLLLISLGGILLVGFFFAPDPQICEKAPLLAVKEGLFIGYNTMNLIAAFLFAPLVLNHFCGEQTTQRQAFKKMIQASVIAIGLLGLIYTGLTFMGSFYTPLLPAHSPEERFGFLAQFILGPWGACFSCLTIALACLTTAIPLVTISAEYIRTDLLKGKGGYLGLFLTLAISGVIAHLGFMGIAAFLSPILQIIYPGMIVLSVLNIGTVLYQMKPTKLPIYAAFGISTVGYLLELI